MSKKPEFAELADQIADSVVAVRNKIQEDRATDNVAALEAARLIVFAAINESGWPAPDGFDLD